MSSPLSHFFTISMGVRLGHPQFSEPLILLCGRHPTLDKPFPAICILRPNECGLLDMCSLLQSMRNTGLSMCMFKTQVPIQCVLVLLLKDPMLCFHIFPKHPKRYIFFLTSISRYVEVAKTRPMCWELWQSKLHHGPPISIFIIRHMLQGPLGRSRLVVSHSATSEDCTYRPLSPLLWKMVVENVAFLFWKWWFSMAIF